MEKVLETRLRQLCAQPLEFWPFQAGLASDERAVRAARGAIYLGAGYAYQDKNWRAAILPLAVAAVLLLVWGRPSSIRLDDASLRTQPNPAGNAPVGDMAGRNPDVASAPPSISMTDFVGRMAQPLRTDDYAIIPVAAPNQAHQVFSDITPLSDLGTSRKPAPLDIKAMR